MGMKNLGRKEDVQETKKAIEQAPSWFLSIPDKKTPWRFLNLDYVEGYLHWYDTGQGKNDRRAVVCAGGIAGGGKAIDECPVCAYVNELYEEAKRLEEEGGDNNKARAQQIRNRAGGMRGRYSSHIKAVRGQRVLVKTKTGKQWVADWDTEDEDSTVEVGVLAMSQSQWNGILNILESSEYPQIGEGSDFLTHTLWSSKVNKKGSRGGKYSQVVWDVDEEETEFPEVEVPEELAKLDISKDFDVDMDEVEKVYRLLSGQEIEEPEDDEEVALEGDSAEEDEPDNEYLDEEDDEEEEEPPKKAVKKKKRVVVEEEEDEDEEDDEDALSDIEDDEDEFVDDIPEPAKPKKKTTRKSGRTKL